MMGALNALPDSVPQFESAYAGSFSSSLVNSLLRMGLTREDNGIREFNPLKYLSQNIMGMPPVRELPLKHALVYACLNACGIPAAKELSQSGKNARGCLNAQLLLIGRLLSPLYQVLSRIIEKSSCVSLEELSLTSVENARNGGVIAEGRCTQQGVYPRAMCFKECTESSKSAFRGRRNAVVLAAKNPGLSKGAKVQCSLERLSQALFSCLTKNSSQELNQIMITAGGMSVKEALGLDVTDGFNVQIILAILYTKLALILNCESQAAGADAADNGLYERRREMRGRVAKPLMDDIDSLFCALGQICEAESAADPDLKELVSGYLSHQECYRTFLNEPATAVENTVLERCLKLMVRKNAALSGGELLLDAQTVMTLMSVMHSCLLNGITELSSYLFEVASYVQQKGRGAENGAPDGSDSPLYEEVRLPERFYPWNWAKAHGQGLHEYRAFSF